MEDKILIVDDTPENLDVVGGILGRYYNLLFAINGILALKIAKAQKPDLILLDVMMPEVDGYEVCRALKEDDDLRDIPIIFLTAKSEVEDEEKGFKLGCVDYIAKPISPPILIERVKTHLALKQAKDFLYKQNNILEERVRERTEKLTKMQDVVMVAMGALAEARDPETGAHIQRTKYYIQILGEELSKRYKYREFLTAENITMISKSAPLHDIGKVGIPDRILLKPGKLTPEEFDEMKLHPVMGYEALLSAENLMDEDDNFLQHAKDIAYGHHEKWDGGGYPQGLAGESIPLSARMMALADVYDALISIRPYKKPFTHKEAYKIIENGSGAHFDPDVVDAFKARELDFIDIAKRFVD